MHIFIIPEILGQYESECHMLYGIPLQKEIFTIEWNLMLQKLYNIWNLKKPSKSFILIKFRDAKITITHICIKALAECLASARSVANGKIVFGKYIQYDTVDVSCLINVEDGKDLAAVLVKNADKMTFK